MVTFRYPPNLLVQELGGEVGSVGPAECVEVWMNGERLEDCGVFEGLKHFPVRFIAQIHVTLRSVREADVNGEPLLISCFNDFRYHPPR